MCNVSVRLLKLLCSNSRLSNVQCEQASKQASKQAIQSLQLSNTVPISHVRKLSSRQEKKKRKGKERKKIRRQ